jgi:hypothetical protein
MKAGFLLIFLGVLGLVSRPVVAWVLLGTSEDTVAAPIRLEAGRAQSLAIHAVKRGDFEIAIEVAGDRPQPEMWCLLGVTTPGAAPCTNESEIALTWVVTFVGQKVASGSSDAIHEGTDQLRAIGNFKSQGSGSYVVAVNVLRSAPTLSGFHPKLTVYRDPMQSKADYFLIDLVAMILNALGALLVLVGIWAVVRKLRRPKLTDQ